jgi:hypothetical protein
VSTSRAFFLDCDPIPTNGPCQEDQRVLSGKRVKRDLYRARDGRTPSADVNGSDKILRKAVSGAFGQRIEAPVVAPVCLTLAWSAQPMALAVACIVPARP